MAKSNVAAVAAQGAVEMEVGENIAVKVEGKTLTLTIDLSKTIGESKSGKSMNIATTGGNVAIPGSNGAVLGLNLYRKK